MKSKTRSWFLIITVAYPVGVSIADQQVQTSTVLDTKLNNTLQIMDDMLCNLPMTFSRILYEAGHHANGKGNVWSPTSEVNQTIDQPMIQGCVDLRRLIVLHQLYTSLKPLLLLQRWILFDRFLPLLLTLDDRFTKWMLKVPFYIVTYLKRFIWSSPLLFWQVLDLFVNWRSHCMVWIRLPSLVWEDWSFPFQSRFQTLWIWS